MTRTRSVLLDGSFVAAIVDESDPLHASVVDAYAGLLAQYERDEVRLFAPSTVLREYERFVRRAALAPIETAWVARQHRTAAASVDAPSFEIAIALVLFRRERFAALATTLPYFDQFEIEIIGPGRDTPDPVVLDDADIGTNIGTDTDTDTDTELALASAPYDVDHEPLGGQLSN